MAFGNRGVASARLAAVAGSPGASTKKRGNAGEPRIRSVAELQTAALKESDEDRTKRLRAKTVNFSCTIFARLVILAGVVWYGWSLYQDTGVVSRGYGLTALAMVGDLGRVFAKMMTPGTK